MACNRLRLGFMLSLPSVLSRDDADLVRTKLGRVIPVRTCVGAWSEPSRICNTSPTCWLGRFGMDATPQSASLFPIALTPSFQPLFTPWRRSLGTGVLPFLLRASVGTDGTYEQIGVEALLGRQIVGLISTPVGADQSYLMRWRSRTAIVFIDRAPSNITADTVVEDDHGGDMPQRPT